MFVQEDVGGTSCEFRAQYVRKAVANIRLRILPDPG